jgi:hypothetical protein
VRIRFTNTDLQDLARLYRGDAAANRRRAQELKTSTQEMFYIEAAMRQTARAQKLDDMASRGETFVLMASPPFDGGPPSLLVVGGSDTKDGSAFISRKRSRS